MISFDDPELGEMHFYVETDDDAAVAEAEKDVQEKINLVDTEQ